MKNGVKYDPVIVFKTGEEYVPADGFHRIYAAQKAGFSEIEAEIREGSLRDAILFAISANVKHGLYRSRADKRHAVLMALQDEELKKLSHKAVADKCAVNEKLVRTIRKEFMKAAKPDSDQCTPKVKSVKESEIAKLRKENEYYAQHVQKLEEELRVIKEDQESECTDNHLLGWLSDMKKLVKPNELHTQEQLEAITEKAKEFTALWEDYLSFNTKPLEEHSVEDKNSEKDKPEK